jgi:transcriptional regulator GlxA family with amidase domain
LTVGAVADACETSVRSVFARFKEHRGCSPLSYMRDVRLNRARDLLIDPELHLSVMDVAIRCGFASFGHFAQRYRQRFGELPSTTLGIRRRSIL